MFGLVYLTTGRHVCVYGLVTLMEILNEGLNDKLTTNLWVVTLSFIPDLNISINVSKHLYNSLSLYIRTTNYKTTPLFSFIQILHFISFLTCPRLIMLEWWNTDTLIGLLVLVLVYWSWDQLIFNRSISAMLYHRYVLCLVPSLIFQPQWPKVSLITVRCRI